MTKKEYHHLYYIRNRTQIRLKQKEYYLNNKVVWTKYYYRNRNSILERHRKWLLKNADYVKEYDKRYAIEHKEQKAKYRRDNRKQIYASRKIWRIKNRDKENQARRERAHRIGKNKFYISKYGGPLPIPRKYFSKQRKYYMKEAGKLDIQTIQRVYEDNIKTFGTLTCIYCFNPIQFGNDTLEHIVPITRGGDNSFRNLAIACVSCNSIKHNKLIAEFIMESEEVK